MVDSVRSVPALTAYLRGQLKSLRPAGVAVPAGSKTQIDLGVRPNAGSRKDATYGSAGFDLAATIARRVAAIEQNDPERRRKAFRVFLESLMLQEWGSQLMNDPGFHQLVDSVQAQMEDQASLHRLMDEAADRLLGSGKLA